MATKKALPKSLTVAKAPIPADDLSELKTSVRLRLPRPLFETKDYEVVLGHATDLSLADELRPTYLVRHKTHNVVAGRSNQLSGAIRACASLQKDLEAAIKNPDEQPLTPYEQYMLMTQAVGGEGPKKAN